MRKKLIIISFCILLLCQTASAFASQTNVAVGKEETETKSPVVETGVSTEMPAVETGVSTEMPTVETGVSTEMPTVETGVSTEMPTVETGIATETPESEVFETGIATDEVVSKIYHLVSTTQKCPVMSFDKKDKLFYLQSGDSIVAYKLDPKAEWTTILIKEEGKKYASLGYIQTVYLKKNKSNKISTKTILADTKFCTPYKDKISCHLFSTIEKQGKKTGILRSKTLLPVLAVDETYVMVDTMLGERYLSPKVIEMIEQSTIKKSNV